jgi:hypothetical protein
MKKRRDNDGGGGERPLMLYVGTGQGDEEGEDIEVETYEAGAEFTVLQGMRAWVGSDVEVVSEGGGGEVPIEDDEEGVLARGRYRWTGAALVYLGRQKGPARPNR